MRDDMNKILTERPRYAFRTTKSPKGYRRKIYNHHNDPDSLFYDSKESMRRIWILALQNKQFSDLLGPLKRYLRSKVGQSWNDIYSEIRSNISPNSKMQLHLLDHVNNYVEQNVTYINNIPYDNNNYRIYDFFVCPITGVLKEAHKKRKRKYKLKDNFIWKDKTNLTQYCKMKGIWYIIYLKEYQYNSVLQIEIGYDVISKNTIYSFTNPNYGGFYYCFKKRQLNKKEIKKAQL